MLVFSLSGCLAAGGHRVSEVKAALEDTLNISGEKLSKSETEWYNAPSATCLDFSGYVYIDNQYQSLSFNDMHVFVFPNASQAEQFYARYRNEQLDYISLEESGENFCIVCDYSMCDAYGKSYVHLKDNVVFLVNIILACDIEPESEGASELDINTEIIDKFNLFIKQDFPLIIEKLR